MRALSVGYRDRLYFCNMAVLFRCRLFLPAVLECTVCKENGTDMKRRRVSILMNAMITEQFLYTSPVNMGVWNIASNCLLRMEKEAQNTVKQKSTSCSCEFKQLNPISLLTVRLRQSKRAQRGSVDSLQWLTAVFCVPILWALGIYSCVAFLFSSVLWWQTRWGKRKWVDL